MDTNLSNRSETTRCGTLPYTMEKDDAIKEIDMETFR